MIILLITVVIVADGRSGEKQFSGGTIRRDLYSSERGVDGVGTLSPESLRVNPIPDQAGDLFLNLAPVFPIGHPEPALGGGKDPAGPTTFSDQLVDRGRELEFGLGIFPLLSQEDKELAL